MYENDLNIKLLSNFVAFKEVSLEILTMKYGNRLHSIYSEC